MLPRSEERLERFKKVLLEQKRRMWNDLREDLFRNTAESLHSQFDIPQDPGEQSMIDVLEDLQLSVADIRRQQLTQLDEAMSKLENGTYGFCEKCGREIDEKRLEVVPFTTHCINCQKEEEAPVYPPEGKI